MQKKCDATVEDNGNKNGKEKRKKCDADVEVYSRVCGFFRPVQQWNNGKKEEFFDRTNYKVEAID